MFGIFSAAACTHAAKEVIIGLLAPISTETPPYGHLPKTVLDDAYVIGFLQVASLAAMERAKGKPVHSRKARRYFFNALSEISPECAKKLPRRMIRWKEADGELMLGRLEGQSYADAFHAKDETALQSIAANFHFMVRHRHLPPAPTSDDRVDAAGL